MGDRASIIISVLNISSGVSSDGGNAVTIFLQLLLNQTKTLMLKVKINNLIHFIDDSLKFSINEGDATLFSRCYFIQG
jgi:hypothetical protein